MENKEEFKCLFCDEGVFENPSTQQKEICLACSGTGKLYANGDKLHSIGVAFSKAYQQGHGKNEEKE